MGTANILEQYLDLTASLDAAPESDGRLARIAGWLETIPAVRHALALDLADPRGKMKLTVPLPREMIRAGSLAELLSPAPDDHWGQVFLFPIRSTENHDLGALIVAASRTLPRDHTAELSLAGRTLRELLERKRLKAELAGRSSPGLPGPAAVAAPLLDALCLCYYLGEPDGKILYASEALLSLLEQPNLSALQAQPQLFAEPERRREELAILRERGRVDAFPLTVNSGGGRRLAVRESARLTDGRILGVFFDVTEMEERSAGFREALQMQELLNDRLFETAKLLQKTQMVAIKSLSRLAEYRDVETGSHLQRIGEYSRLLASRVREVDPYAFTITEDYAQDISVSSMLHDIGKVAIPDHILLKRGRLTGEEWRTMKNHTTWGGAILAQADRELGEQSFLTLASKIALHHHERYDGDGYPSRLSGEEIPLSARIVAVADVYDALAAQRPYKPPWPHERIVAEIGEQRGRQFDPVLVDIFMEKAARFRDIREKFPH
jgi:HD-GYP domain-containing protein (c-di-GMP phosphodiesterase class II)/PAS domain-containing protein